MLEGTEAYAWRRHADRETGSDDCWIRSKGEQRWSAVRVSTATTPWTVGCSPVERSKKEIPSTA
jgi:hypothetical protein